MRVFIFLLVSGLAHFLAARWLLSTWAPEVRAKRWRVVLGVAGGLSLLLATMRVLSARYETATVRTMIAIAMLELGAVTIALLPIGAMTVLTRGLAWAGRVARRNEATIAPTPAPTATPDLAPTPTPTPDARVSRRKAIERAAGISFFGATTVALGWGMVRGRHAFALEEVVVRVKGWPRVLDGYVIAQVSDVHVGAFVGDRELDEGFELVKKMKPDLMVATGDLVDFDSEAVGPLALRLMAAGARDGAYAILGNHDHYAGPADVVRLLRETDVRVLSNQSTRLRAGDGGGFALVGVDDLRGRAVRRQGFAGPDFGAAVAGLDEEVPRILLAHQPLYFRESAGRVALQLSGHTHGGQINPGFRPADLVMEYVSGRYERKGSTLWVNRGFGVAGPPSRLGAPPEITKIVLVSG